MVPSCTLISTLTNIKMLYRRRARYAHCCTMFMLTETVDRLLQFNLASWNRSSIIVNKRQKWTRTRVQSRSQIKLLVWSLKYLSTHSKCTSWSLLNKLFWENDWNNVGAFLFKQIEHVAIQVMITRAACPGSVTCIVSMLGSRMRLSWAQKKLKGMRCYSRKKGIVRKTLNVYTWSESQNNLISQRTKCIWRKYQSIT